MLRRFWKPSPPNGCSSSPQTPWRSATKCYLPPGPCSVTPGSPRPTPTASSAPGSTTLPPTGHATPRTRPISTAAACGQPQPKPQHGSRRTPPDTRRSARPNEDFLRASDRAHRRGVRRRQSFTAFLLVLVVGLASVTALALRAQHEADYQREIVIDAARAWFVDGGKAELQLLSARADAVGYAATSTYPKLGRACSSLATAVKTAQADPPIPNAVAQQWFARALAQFKVSAADCQLAVAAHSVALVNKAAVPMRAANEDVSRGRRDSQND